MNVSGVPGAAVTVADMPGTARRSPWARLASAVVCACTLAACGGGGSSPAASEPSNLIMLSTTRMAFAGFGGTVSTQQVQVGENGYSGAFSENDTCTPRTDAQIAGVTELTPGNPATYSVTPLADGSCVVTFTDTNGQTANITVTVGASGTQSGPRQ